jgi:predicted permease
MAGFLQDLRYAWRQIRKAPVFSLVAILTLALSIGGTVTIFSFVDGILLKPLAYRQSGQLTVVWEHVRFLEHLVPYTGPNPRQVFAWRQSQTSFNDLVLLREDATGISLTGDHPQFAGRVRTEPALLHMLSVQPVLGRDFRPEDGSNGHEDSVIISWTLWKTLFSGSEDVLGKTLYVGTVPAHVIGVLPKNFYFPKANELASTPMAQVAPSVDVLQAVAIHPENYGWNEQYGNFIALGRLKPGVTLDGAKAQLDALCNQIARQAPPPQDFGPNPEGAISVVLTPLKEAIVGKTSQPLWLLLAAVLSVLLIACVNLANAQLARAMRRDREAAVRVALGSTMWSLLRTSVLESLLLSVAGGALGVWLAHAVIVHFADAVRLAVPRAENVTVNGLVLTLAVVCTVVATLACALLPMLRYRNVDPRAAMQGSGRASGSSGGTMLRRCLVGLQMLACTALLLLTALFANNMMHLLRIDRGFSSDNTMLASVRMQGKGLTDERLAGFDDAVLERLRALPGVTHAAMVSSVLSQGQTWVDGVERTDGGSDHPVLAQYRWISPDYFTTMDQQILEGRPLDARDRQQRNAVISQATATVAWPGENALGRTFRRGDKEFTVVGIAADARTNSLGKAPESMVFLPYWDNPPYQSFFLIHGSQDLSAQTDSIRNAIWSFDPTVTIDSIARLDTQVENSVAPERMETVLLAGFGGLALILAVLGVYGMLHYSVERRVQEFGIRMALGAGRSSIYWTALQDVALPIGAGLLGGWLLSIVVGRAVRSMLVGSASVGAGMIASVIAVLCFAALLAAFIPCRNAAYTEPMDALRTE